MVVHHTRGGVVTIVLIIDSKRTVAVTATHHAAIYDKQKEQGRVKRYVDIALTLRPSLWYKCNQQAPCQNCTSAMQPLEVTDTRRYHCIEIVHGISL